MMWSPSSCRTPLQYLSRVAAAFLTGAVVLVALPAATPAQSDPRVADAAARAEAWLLGIQNPDGSFGASEALRPRDSASAVRALVSRGLDGPAVERGLAYLAGSPESTAELRARRIAALARAARPVGGLLAALFDFRNGEGFAAFGAHGSNLYDTALAVRALSVDEETYLLDLPPLLDYLQAHQNHDGGWGYVPGDTTRTYFTAEVALGLAGLERLAVASDVLTAAGDSLVARQTADGGFGTPLETAVAYRALLALGRDVSALPASPVEALLTAQSADGSWGGDPFATAQALLALGRELPNLTVSALSATPETVIPGEPVTITATVENRGPVAADGTTLVVRNGSGEKLAEASVPSLDPGAEATVETTVATDGAAGTDELVLTATADGRSAVDEISETDNESSVRVALVGEADLALFGSDLSVSPERPAPGEEFLLRAAVRNRGGEPVTAFGYRITEIAAGAEVSVLAEGTAGPADPGAGALLELPLTLAEGEHLVRVEVDPEDSVEEADETNNRAETAFFVVDDTLPDLAVARSDLTASPERPAVGETVDLVLQVHNEGAREASAGVAFFDGAAGGGAGPFHATTVTVPAGGGAAVSASFTTGAETRFVTAVVDPEGVVDELSEVNNRTRKILVDLPDLSLGRDNLELASRRPLEGETVHGTVTVRNAGTAESPTADVEVWDGEPDAGGSRIFSGSVPAIPAGGNRSTTFTWSAAGGLHPLVARVDPGDAVAELSDANNRTLREVAVPRVSGPNLVVGSVDRSAFSQDPSTLAASGSVTVTVDNVGDAPAGSFLVRLFEDRDGDGRLGSGDLELASQTVSGVPAGESAPVTLAVDATLRFHRPLIQMELDATDLVAERREDDNRRALFGQCIASPPAPSFDAVEEWHVPGLEVESAPVVVQLTDDDGDGAIDSRDVPDVVFHTEDTDGRAITARSGLGGSELWTVRSTAANPLAGRIANLAAADLNGDGVAEVIGVRSDRRLVALTHRGEMLWVSDLIESAGGRSWAGAPAVGDLTGDGVPEIAVGRSVLSNTGRLLAQGTANVGRNRNYYGPFGVPYLIDAPLSTIADVDRDGRAELVAGDALYRLEGGTLEVVWDRTVPDDLMVDGFSAVAELDGDPESEIVYVSSNQVMVLEHDGSVAASRRQVQPLVPFGERTFWAGPPSIGDLDGDGTPEILISASKELVALRANLSTLWRVSTTEASEMVGTSTFDLDGDGAAEVLTLDQTRFRILDGATGSVLHERPNTSKTATELPVVADVDGDGRAEILVPSNRSFGGDSSTQGLHALGHSSWQGTRPIWNQHTFRGTNALLDGTVPAAGTPPLRPGDRFRSNRVLPAPERLLPNLTLGLPRVGRATEDGVPVTVRVGNGGRGAIPAGVRVVLYDGDPFAGGSPAGEAVTTGALRPGAYEDLTILWQAAGAAGIDAWAWIDPEGALAECDEADNRISFVLEESVLPDVAIPAGGVTVSGAPVEGQVLPVAVQVDNAGAAEAAGFSVRIYDGEPGVGAVIGEVPVASLPPGDSATVEIAWDTLEAGDGLHALHAVADAAGALVETDEENNRGLAEVELTPATRPDPSLDSFTVEPAQVEAGAEVLFRAEVVNRGAPLDGGVEGAFLINRAEVGRVSAPATLGTGERTALEMPVSTTGRQGLLEAAVQIDPDDAVAEENESDNRATAELRVAGAAVSLAVGTDRLSYAPGESVALTVTADNSSSDPLDGTLRVAVVDSAGAEIAELGRQTVTLEPGAVELPFTWQTGDALPGGYAAMAELSAGGARIARAETLFNVERQVELDARLFADRDLYPATASAVLSGRVASASTNTILQDLSLRLAVADASGVEVWSTTRTLSVLYPGSDAPVEEVWEIAGADAGTYTASFEVRDASGLLLAFASTGLAVEDSAKTGAGLTGDLVVAPELVGAGAPVRFDYRVSNDGNADQPDLTLRVDLIRLADETVADSAAVRRSIPVGGEAAGSLGLPTLSLSPGDYLATLIGALPGTDVRLDRAALTIGPGVSVADAVGPEGDSGTGSLVFRASLSEPTDTEVTVSYATADGTAVAGEDYQAASGTLTFAPGEVEKTVSVPVVGDLLEESHEVFLLSLSDPAGVLAGDLQALGTLLDEEGCASPNLLINPGAESGDFDDPVPGWQPGDPGAWVRRLAAPTPLEGVAAFAVAGEAASAELVQEVNLSPFAARIDAGAQAFQVEGFVRSAAASDPDVARLVVEYLDATGVVLDTFDSGEVASPDAWRALADLRTPPAGTRAARVRLVATRVAGATLEVAFDRLGLRSVGTPVLSVADVETLEGDSGTTAAAFPVTLSCARSTDVRLDWATADGTASAAEDYQAASGTLTLAAGETSGAVDVQVVGDGTDEPDETFVLEASSPDDPVVLTPRATGTVRDDDGAAVLSVLDVNLPEGDGPGQAEVPVELSAVSGKRVTALWTTAENTGGAAATAGEDYTAASGTVTFEPGETAGTVRVPLPGDRLNEPDESFRVRLSDPTAATLGQAEATVTLLDDDPVGIHAADASVVEGDAGTVEARFPVRLSVASVFDVEVAYATADGTAVAGSDYQAAAGTLSIPAGETEGLVTVPVLGDAAREPVETFLLTLSAPVNASLADPEGVGTIVDDDGILISVDDVTVREGADAAAIFRVSLNKATTVAVSADFATAEGTAVAGADYSAATGTVEIPAGSTVTEVRVPLVDDVAYEPTESFRLVLSDPSGEAILLDAEGEASLLDDDGWHLNGDADDAAIPGCIVLTPDTRHRRGSAWNRTKLDLSRSFDKTLRVYLGDRDDGGAHGMYFALQSEGPNALGGGGGNEGYGGIRPSVGLELDTRTDARFFDGADHTSVGLNGSEHAGHGPVRLPEFNIEDGEEHELRVIWNAVTKTFDLHFDGVESLVYSRDVVADLFGGVPRVFWGMTGATGFRHNLEYFCDTARCLDGDAPTLVSVGDTRVSEGDAGTVQAHFPVTLSCPMDEPVTVSYGTEEGTATAGDDYLPVSGSVTFEPGETSADVTVDVVGETVGEPDERFYLALSAPSSGEIRYRRGTGTIRTDDHRVTADGLRHVEGDRAGATVAVDLVLDRPAPTKIEVAYATADGTARAGSDYQAVSGTVTFRSGDTLRRIAIPWLGDTIAEGDERFFLELSTSSDGATVVDPRPAVTVVDDDACPGGNLLDNPSADAPLIDGEIPDWTEVSGGRWTQRTHSPAPYEGPAYFFPGAAAEAELRQDVDVGAFAARIDQGDQAFELLGVVRSYNQSPPDSSRIVLEYRDAEGAVLETFDSGARASRRDWRVVGDLRAAPPGTRTIRVRLIAERHAGSNNDGYFDALVLRPLGLPSLGIDDVELPEGEAGTSEARFTVNLSCPAEHPVSVDFLTADGTATAGEDYEATAGSLSFAPGQTTAAVQVPVFGDTVFEESETFSVEILNPSGAGVTDGRGVATILQDEAFASVEDTSVVEGASGVAEAVFTVTMSAPSPLPVSVGYATRDGSATAGEDYELTTGTLTFDPGQTERTVTIPVLGDLEAEGDEVFHLELTEPVNVSLQVAEAACTVIDDDAAVSVGDATVVEGSSGSSAIVFPVTLSRPVSETVTVDYATRDGLAVQGEDYVASSGSVSLAPGELEASISVQVLGDEEVEPSETFELVLSNPVHAGIVDGTARGSIVDDDDCPGPNLLENPGAEERLVGGEIPGWVETSSAEWTTRSVNPAPYDGRAAFDAGSGGTVELRQDVDVSAYAERIDRGVQPFVFEGFVRSEVESPADSTRVVVELRGSDNAEVLDIFDSGDLQSPDGWRQVADMRTAPAGTRWIRVRLIGRRTGADGRNDALFDALALRSLAAPVLRAGRGSVLEGDDGSRTVEVPVALNCPDDGPVSASYATRDASAVAGLDYLQTSGTVSLAAGETATTVPVSVLGDTELELEETFSLYLSEPSGAVVVEPRGTGAITDDDNAGAATKELRTFWIEDLRIFAWAPDTEITLIDIDTGQPLSMNDSRIRTSNVSTNPFVLDEAGDSFEGRVRGNVRVKVAAGDPSGQDQLKPITVWTGQLSSGLRHPDEPPSGNPWVSYIPAFSIRPRANGRELGNRFLGFTSRELTLFVRKGEEPTRIVVEDLATNADLDTDDGRILGPADADYADDEIEIYFLDGFEDDTVRISSNAELSALAGISSREGPDWTVSPPSYALGDDGIELGTEFYTFAHRSLTVFPVEDDTTVEITDLSDGDDSFTTTLAEGDTDGGYELFTPVLDTRNGSGIVPRTSDPEVSILSTGNRFDNDYVKVESDKPVLVYVGPAGSDVNEFADVAFSVPTGTESRIIYCYAQNGGGQRDLQIFGFTDDTEVEITSLTTTSGFQRAEHHDFRIGPGLGGDGGWLRGQPGSDVWWGSAVWDGEMLRIESNKPVVVINGDYDSPHFGAFIPFLVDSRDLPPVADAGLDRTVIAGETVVFDGTGSFDQDDVAGPLTPRHEWDLDLDVDSDGNGDPADDLDAVGPTPERVYLEAGGHPVQLTYRDDEGESDTDRVQITVEPHPLSLTKEADVESVAPGETVGYVLTVTNTADAPATDVVVSDPLPAHTTLSGTVSTDRGTVLGRTPVEVALGTLEAGATAEVRFAVSVDSPLEPGIERIENRATVAGAGLPPFPSDDPTTPEPFDPTVTPIDEPPVVAEPDLRATKTDELALDADGDGTPSPGDEIGYTLEVTNVGGGPATDVSLTDRIPDHAAVVPGSVATDFGTVVTESPVEVDLGELPAGATATVTFRVAIDLPVPAGVDRVTNQGTVTSAELPAVLTDDPDLGGDADPTVTMITAVPELVVEKTDRLALDADGDGAVSPGDRVEYTVTVRNVGNTAATAVGLADPIPGHTSLVSGSIVASQGTVDDASPTVAVTLGEIPGGGSADVRFAVTVDSPIAAGVRELSNQGLVASAELPDVVTDDPEVDGPADPTVTAVVAAPELLVEKGDSLFEDADGDGLASPGDELLYRITVRNRGNTPATGVTLIDPIPENTVLVPETLRSSHGSIASGDPVAVDVGQVDVGAEVAVTFRTRIAEPFPLDVLAVANQAEIASAELEPVLSDDPETAEEADPTVTEVYLVPDVAVGDVTVDEAAGPAVFTVSLSRASNRPVRVPYATADTAGGSATSPASAGLDYLAASGTATFEPGTTERTVSVEVLDDALDELDETFALELGAPLDGPKTGVLADGAGLGTILDDDPPPFVSIGDATVVEGDPGGDAPAELVFPVTLSGPSGLGVAVDYETGAAPTGRAAEAGVDYTSISGTLSLPAGSVSSSVRVPVTADRIDELDEVLAVRLTNPVATVPADAEAVGTITDDDQALLSIDDARVAEGDEGSADALVPVRLSLPADREITADYASVPGTAVEGSDYRAADGTLSVPAGETEATVAVPVLGDLLLEPLEETLTLELSDPVVEPGTVEIEDGVGVVTIVDDEECPGPNLLENASAEEVAVDGELPGWSQVVGADWQRRLADPGPFEGSAFFAAGETDYAELTQSVSVQAYEVRVSSAEGQRFAFSGRVRTAPESPADTARIVVEYLGGAGSVVLDAYDTGEIVSPDGWREVTDERTAPAGTGWIRVRLIATRFTGPSNDAFFDALELRSLRAATLSVDDVTVYEGDPGTTTDAVFTVSLACPVDGEVTVDFSTADGPADGTVDGGAVAGDDYLSTSGGLAFAPGETGKEVPVTVLGDALHELHETFTLELSGHAPSDVAVLLDPSGTGLILNDDFCPRSPGFWKNHTDLWPAERLEIGGVEYGFDDLLGFLRARGGDATLHLARQLVATKLNLLVGSEPDILPVVEDADAYLIVFPPGSNPKRQDKQDGNAIKDLLDAYNNSPCEETPVIPE